MTGTYASGIIAMEPPDRAVNTDMADQDLNSKTQRRNRVRGTGPGRDELPSYHHIATLTEFELAQARRLVDEQFHLLGEDYNDIDNPFNYEIAQTCPLKQYFPSTYRQILLQLARSDGANIDESAYTYYRPETVGFHGLIRRYIPYHYRARIATLVPGDILDWHIDTDTSYSCRIHFMVHGEACWQIKRRKEIHEQVMRPGEIWFANTGFNHRVENQQDINRIAIVVGSHYSGLTNIVPKL